LHRRRWLRKGAIPFTTYRADRGTRLAPSVTWRSGSVTTYFNIAQQTDFSEFFY
jgi:hypothetical protein